MRSRSGVAGESSSNQPLCPASSLAEYTASCTVSTCVIRVSEGHLLAERGAARHRPGVY